MTITVVRSLLLGAVERGFQFIDGRHLLGDGTERLGMGAEVDRRQGVVARVLEQIVEAGAAGRLLQAVDAAEAAIVEHDDGELLAEHHRGGEFGIHHQIGAVADHDDDVARRASRA